MYLPALVAVLAISLAFGAVSKVTANPLVVSAPALETGHFVTASSRFQLNVDNPSHDCSVVFFKYSYIIACMGLCCSAV